MKDFYYVRERGTGMESEEVYYENKRQTILETIEPICEAFGIKEYDYIAKKGSERLIVEGQAIGCTSNSIGAVVRELIIYIFITSEAIERVSHFQSAVINDLKRHWLSKK